MTNKLRSELLIPAGSLARLKVAIRYGADAVYMGTPDLSLRTKSKVTIDEVREGIEYAHNFGKKVYLTLNLFSHNSDIEKLPIFVKTINQVKPDGVIIADPGVFQYLKDHAPEVELHISTQANICSWLSVKFWQEQGASLCVMARETSFAELTEIREKCPDIKLEAFVHGSMCMTYSGRCLLSNFMSERGANQGNCAHSCRWNYKLHIRLKDGTIKALDINEENNELFEFLLEEEVRPGELMPIEEDNRGSYILNSKDLCLMPKLSDYLELGIDSLKIEGRNKSEYYVAMVTRAYRMAMDDWAQDPENFSADKYMKELNTISNRGYTLAFHEGRLSNLAHNYESTRSISTWEYAGLVVEVNSDHFVVEVKNRLEAGDVLEFVPPPPANTYLLRLYDFIQLKHNDRVEEITSIVNPGYKPLIKIPFTLFDQVESKEIIQNITKYTVLRKEKPLTETDLARIKLDLEAAKLEQGQDSDKKFKDKQQDLIKAKIANDLERAIKSPRVGTEGCCGRGCNGCLIFWHDEKYAKARKLLKEKKLGEMLC